MSTTPARYTPIVLALVAGVGLTLFLRAGTGAAEARVDRDSFTRTDLNDVVIGHPDGTLVRVEAEAEVTVVPDVARTDATFLFEAPTADAAQRDVNDRVRRYMLELGRLGVAENRIQTVGFFVRPRYDFNDRRGRDPRVVGYIASNTVRVRTEVELLDDVVDAAFNNGVDRIDRILFEIDDEEGAFLDALALATERARVRAERVAQALGGEVTQIVEVREPERTRLPVRAFAQTGVQRGLATDADETEPLAPGEQTLRASVEFAAVIVVGE
jgi:uncharacterized protein